MALHLVTSPEKRNASATPVAASFQGQSQAVVGSLKASSTPARSIGGSLFGISRDGNVSTTSGDEDLSRVDPDELFVRFTVTQVKTLASKLQAEADAKQEELRMMVGERYRDLLQASTSIVDMANSSQTVVNALEDMKDTCSEQTVVRVPVISRSGTETDTQLKTLQSLAAHLKLLLDCPEHFWRLLEHKEYLDAAWLFKVAQLVHHSLVEESEVGDEEVDRWSNQGIDVADQFPLVQRQWDVINGFRAQISHKATQSLREEMSPWDVLHAVASLVLLDSMSLSDTLGVFLSQRNKSVQSFLASSSINPIKGKATTQDISGTTDKRSRNRALRDVERTLSRSIKLLVGTMNTARILYHGRPSSRSTVETLISDFVSGAADTPVSTNKVLSSLPSASLLDLYLPPKIKNYTPYIDTSEPWFHISPQVLSSKLDEWFNKGLASLSGKIEEWVLALKGAAEVDEVCTTALSAPIIQTLLKSEHDQLSNLVNQACSKRIAEIWKDAFVSLRQEFQASLSSALGLIRASDASAKADLNPANALFSSGLPFPPSSGSNQSQSSIDSAFSKFTVALAQRCTNRTPLLDAIVSIVENQTRKLQEEFEAISGGKLASMNALISQFEPFENEICQEFVAALQRELDLAATGEDEGSLNAIIFVGRVAFEMCGSVSFVDNLLASGKAVQDFKEAAERIHIQTLSTWSSRCVSRLLKHVEPVLSPVESEDIASIEVPTVSGKPSSTLLDALVSLILDTRRLGLSRTQLYSKRIFSTVLEQFAVGWLALINVGTSRINKDLAQVLWDLVLLEKICTDMKVERHVLDAFQRPIEQLDKLMGAKAAQKIISDTRSSVNETLPRFRLLLSPFLQPPVAAELGKALLQAKPPASGETTAVNLAQPSPRFGLLLVSGPTQNPSY